MTRNAVLARLLSIGLGAIGAGFLFIVWRRDFRVDRQVVRRVLIPATMPGVMDSLRVTLGWAWTYLVVAELVAANKGLGYFILNSMRGLFTDRIFLGIAVIGLLGLISDQLFKAMRSRLLPWTVQS